MKLNEKMGFCLASACPGPGIKALSEDARRKWNKSYLSRKPLKKLAQSTLLDITTIENANIVLSSLYCGHHPTTWKISSIDEVNRRQ